MRATGEMQLGLECAGRLAEEGTLHAEDLHLARRAAVRDEAAWRDIYESTRERLFALLVYQTGRREEARELLQETYLSALKSIHRYRGRGSLSAWLAVIAIRRARDWRRRLFRRRRRDEEFERVQAPGIPPAPDAELRARLQRALARLGERQRAAFLLHELQGLRFREIGQALGCSEATARVHCFRARGRLKGFLESPPDHQGDWP